MINADIGTEYGAVAALALGVGPAPVHVDVIRVGACVDLRNVDPHPSFFVGEIPFLNGVFERRAVGVGEAQVGAVGFGGGKAEVVGVEAHQHGKVGHGAGDVGARCRGVELDLHGG